jgi:hypothetical protein
MHFRNITGAALAAAACALTPGPAVGEGTAAGEGINPNYQGGSSQLHCHKGCDGRDIKVIVDDQQEPCKLQLQYDTVTVHHDNHGIDDAGVKLRWVIDDRKSRGQWFFYPGAVALAGNNGDFTDNGPDDTKKKYGWTDMNKQPKEFSTKYTIVVKDKDQRAKCSATATIANKGSGGAKKKAAAAPGTAPASGIPDPRLPCRGRRNTTTPCT